jgi:hypothetical protein
MELINAYERQQKFIKTQRGTRQLSTGSAAALI